VKFEGERRSTWKKEMAVEKDRWESKELECDE